MEINITKSLLIELDKIIPDPNQPRRVIPTQVAQKLAKGKVALPTVCRSYIQAEGKTPQAKRIHSEIRTLAQNIMREMQARPETHGLINPITVRPLGDGRYVIETGELRFWAMVLLRESNPETAAQYNVIPAQIIEQASAMRQTIENVQRRSMNAMETAWALQRVWNELKQKEPEFFPPGGKNSVGRPREWPTWLAVSERVGMSFRTVSQYVALLELPLEAQTIVHDYDIPERRLRYMLQRLPRPKYNTEIVRILKRATAGDVVWSSKQFQEEVDRVLHLPQDAAPRLAKVRGGLKQTRTNIASIFQGGRIDSETVRRYRQELGAANQDSFDQLVKEAQELLPYLTALLGASEDSE